jgi:DNA-binding GntR family transcriptional regulator
MRVRLTPYGGDAPLPQGGRRRACTYKQRESATSTPIIDIWLHPALCYAYGATGVRRGAKTRFGTQRLPERFGGAKAMNEHNIRATTATVVYERIRDDILSGALAPELKLKVEFVCDRYGAGASPVREALNRLSQDGLVERRDQRGFYVAPVSLERFAELVKTRCWLEAIALRESIAGRTVEWEERLVLAFHRLSRTRRSLDEAMYLVNPAWEDRHREFHHALIANCGSSWLLGFCHDMGDQAERYRKLAAARVYPQRQGPDEHRAILDAAVEGDADEAVALLDAHYRKTQRIIEEAFRSRAG